LSLAVADIAELLRAKKQSEALQADNAQKESLLTALRSKVQETEAVLTRSTESFAKQMHALKEDLEKKDHDIAKLLKSVSEHASAEDMARSQLQRIQRQIEELTAENERKCECP